jgi:hypothetical protein
MSRDLIRLCDDYLFQEALGLFLNIPPVYALDMAIDLEMLDTTELSPKNVELQQARGAQITNCYKNGIFASSWHRDPESQTPLIIPLPEDRRPSWIGCDPWSLSS